MPEAISIVALIVASVACVATIALYSEIGRLALRLDPERSDLPLVPNEGLAKGVSVPRTVLDTFPSGSEIGIGNGAVLIVFVAANCVPCRKLWPGVRQLASETNDLRVIAMIGDDPLVFSESIDNAPVQLVFDSDGQLAEAFLVKRTPFAYMVDGGKVRSKGVVNTYKQLATLVGGHGLAQPSPWREEMSS